MQDLTIAKTILAQLGGPMFTAMTGARQFVGGNDYLAFKLPSNFANQGINYIKITLDPSDTYSVEAGKLRGHNYRVIAEQTGLYADQLQTWFKNTTGLDTSL